MTKKTECSDALPKDLSKSDYEKEMYYLNKMLKRKHPSLKKLINKGKATSLKMRKAREDIPYQN